MRFQTKYIAGWGMKAHTRLLFIFAVACSALMAGMMTDTTQALRAPDRATGGEPTYYYVSDNIKQNGDFPNSYVAFYWKEPGTKTITYTGRQCNNGGYEDNTDSDVFMTVYPINTDGTANLTYATRLDGRTNVNRCHDGQNTSFTFTIPATSRDSKTGLYGAVAYVAMNGTGRAFFTLNTSNNNADGTEAMFGALGTRTIGYSRDFNPNQSGFYNITMNFGNICSTTDFIERIRFYDVDHNNQYQRSTMTFRVRNVDTNTWLDNTDNRFIYDGSRDQITRTGNQTTFAITSGSGGQSSIRFNLAAGARYQLEVRNISEMNDIGISIPSSEIYGKATCDPPIIIPTAYQLAPVVIGPVPAVVSTGDQATFSTSVTNGSTTLVSNPTDWTVRRIIVPTGVTPPSLSRTGTIAAQFNCAYYISLGMQCSQLASSNQRFNPGSTPVGAGSYVEPIASPAGFRVCYAVTVNSYTEAPRDNFREGMYCVVVGKNPNLEARNGDVLAGGRFKSESPTCSIATKPIIASSQRQSGGLFYTSYATYGATSYGASQAFGSMGLSYDTSPTTLADNLVFANTSNVDGYFGNTTAQGTGLPPALSRCLNDPFNIFASSAVATNPGTSINLSTISSNTRLTASSAITLTSGPIVPGKRIVIYAPNADIHITSDIAYQNVPYASIDRIPQVVILTDRNIIIHGNVTQLDGIYAARRNVYTCDVLPGLRVCDARLTVNGAVVAGQNIVPLRTAGASAPNFAEMAETFNLRPDLLLGQLPDPSSSTTYLKTVNENEVPARF